MFLEFNCGHFGIKTKSVGPSYQKLRFCPYKEMGVAKRGPSHEYKNCIQIIATSVTSDQIIMN